MRKNITIAVLLFVFFGTTIKANAASMSNGGFTLDQNQVNILPFSREEPKKIQAPMQKIYASGKNYLVNTNSPTAFHFSISQEMIDFGKLTATNPIIRTLDLDISSNNNNFQILATEDHPLKANTNLTIPDTTCDNGSCSELTASLWDNTLTYGFGYQFDGNLDKGFKQFSDPSRSKDWQIITTNPHERINYKVNISATQPAGSYSNTVTYIATPDF